jgi:hypothetical protein
MRLEGEVGRVGDDRGAYRVWVQKGEASKLTSLGVAVDWIDLA